MTQAEFTTKVMDWHQRQRRALMALKVGVVGCVVAVSLVSLRFDTSEPETIGRTVYPVVLLLMVLATYVARRLIVQRIARRYGISCPACQKSLGPVAPTVMETGKCGHCGEVICSEG